MRSVPNLSPHTKLTASESLNEAYEILLEYWELRKHTLQGKQETVYVCEWSIAQSIFLIN